MVSCVRRAGFSFFPGPPEEGEDERGVDSTTIVCRRGCCEWGSLIWPSGGGAGDDERCSTTSDWNMLTLEPSERPTTFSTSHMIGSNISRNAPIELTCSGDILGYRRRA